MLNPEFNLYVDERLNFGAMTGVDGVIRQSSRRGDADNGMVNGSVILRRSCYSTKGLGTTLYTSSDSKAVQSVRRPSLSLHALALPMRLHNSQKCLCEPRGLTLYSIIVPAD